MDAAGTAIGEEGAMHGTNLEISRVSVSLQEGVLYGHMPPESLNLLIWDTNASMASAGGTNWDLAVLQFHRNYRAYNIILF